MSPDTTTVNIIPEFHIPSTIFNQLDGSAKRSFSGVIDFLVTKLPAKYTAFLLNNPTTALAALGNTQELMSSSIFEAELDRVQVGLSRATIAAASYCQLRGLNVIRGVVTSGEQWIFFVYKRHPDGTGRVLSSEQYTLGENLEGLALVLGLLRDSIDNTTSSDHTFFTTT
ncbi:uncharacterized protein F5147DRAFT_223085 [Suillus discolor]|uniref:Uncharacterized protein n=1 Tax=Suillus discolor TaxID=1912936 RepID=A0A9P7JT48_9AGAM|nr:uncharacterized protein F5147DRAFT_223085 [Suillus discolor]KAG2106733.1 hypothetical protein F5147DRAFT_223085 [Suillus discolor]